MQCVWDSQELRTIWSQIGVGSAHVRTLYTVLYRVLNEGYSQCTVAEHIQNLQACAKCAIENNFGLATKTCIDNDEWAKDYDSAHFDARKPSADFFVIMTDGVESVIQFVEAKLGVIGNGSCRYPKKRELDAKYDYSVKRVDDNFKVIPELIVLFSRGVIEKMRNRFSRFNREDSQHKIKCQCVQEYLAHIGCSISNVQYCMTVDDAIHS